MSYCDECSGRNERIRAEAIRWNALSADEKINELLARVEALESRSRWDGRIG